MRALLQFLANIVISVNEAASYRLPVVFENPEPLRRETKPPNGCNDMTNSRRPLPLP